MRARVHIILFLLVCVNVTQAQVKVTVRQVMDSIRRTSGRYVFFQGNPQDLVREVSNDEWQYSLYNRTVIIRLKQHGTENNKSLSAESVLIKRDSTNLLDKAVVAAYSAGTRRNYTGDIAYIGRQQLDKYPVSDPLTALAGRVSGLLITKTSGVYGSIDNITLRGRSSILNNSAPFIIIDGIPFAPGNQSVSNIAGGNAAGSLNPLSFLSSDDLESIKVLKDVDATAMYGSRGANGVILFTTRRGMPGRSSLDLHLSTGISAVTTRPALMNTRQYIAMRTEALQNDGEKPDGFNAPELTQWDTTSSTDWGKYFVGGLGSNTHMRLSLANGGASTNYFFGLGQLHESNVFPTNPAHDLLTFTGNLNHRTTDGRLEIKANGLFGWDVNRQFTEDISRLQFLLPQVSSLQTDGKSIWTPNDTYKASSRNFLAGIEAVYRLTTHLSVRNTTGYSSVDVQEASEGHAHTAYRNWMFEPRLEYRRRWGQWNTSFLTGGSWQDAHSFIDKTSMVGTQQQSSGNLYGAIFAGLHLKWKEKLLLDLTGRRDVSARFGLGQQAGNFGWLGRQSGNFGSAALGWIFSDEPAIQQALPFISFGKLRVGYGVTGNDQPRGMGWETIAKQEIGIDLGLFDQRITLSAVWYRHHSLNQLLPDVYPFGLVAWYSAPVTVQNKGWEFDLTSINVDDKHFKWTTSINTSLAANKLTAFPGLAATPFAGTLTVGQSLTSRQGLRFLGVDKGTGVFRFPDKDADMETMGNLDPHWYGGMDNTLTWHRWQLSSLLEWRVQQGLNSQAAMYAYNPPGAVLSGLYSNQTTELLDRWRRPGDRSAYQRLTTKMNTAAGQAIPYYLSSSAVLTNASFVRLRSLSLSYQLPEAAARKMRLRELKFSLQAQNLLTLTPYRNADPEIQDLMILPSMRTICVGVEVKF